MIQGNKKVDTYCGKSLEYKRRKEENKNKTHILGGEK